MKDSALPILRKILKSCTDVKQNKAFGRRHLGYFVTLPSGKKVYIVVRRNMQMYRGQEYCQTDAIQKGVATWMLDKEVLRAVVKAKVAFVVFFAKDSGDVYTSTIETWLDPKIGRDVLLSRSGETRHVGIQHMAKSTIYSHLTLR